jgi:cytochrome c peroxidase
MKSAPISSSVGLVLVCSLAATLTAAPDDVSDRLLYDEIVLAPLPPQPQPPNIVPLSAGEQLGKDIFFDSTLSNPKGYACASCHAPQTGFTGPSSAVNILAGPVPGVIAGRVGKRKPQTVPYAAFSPDGPAFNADLQVYVGGNFWDGRTPDTAHQARMPFLDPNEMANAASGPYPPHADGFSPMVAQKLASRPYAPLFRQALGTNVFKTRTDEQLYELATSLIASYEASAEVVQFSSKYDASQYGTSAKAPYVLSASEERGRALFFGKAQCSACHSSGSLPSVLAATHGRDTFTMYCYANIGVPRNPGNPYYDETDSKADPIGSNPLGPAYIDYGLGSNPNPGTDGTVFMNQFPGDIQMFRGLFKAPSLRNSDKRPNPSFVKSYMHNGVFKSLKDVVHFYNKRNIAADPSGDEAAFDLRLGPPAGYEPVFDPPEVIDNVQNAAGVSPDNAGDDVDNNGQVGNLGLSDSDEDDLVNFLSTLTDGYALPVKGGEAGARLRSQLHPGIYFDFNRESPSAPVPEP